MHVDPLDCLVRAVGPAVVPFHGRGGGRLPQVVAQIRWDDDALREVPVRDGRLAWSRHVEGLVWGVSRGVSRRGADLRAGAVQRFLPRLPRRFRRGHSRSCTAQRRVCKVLGRGPAHDFVDDMSRWIIASDMSLGVLSSVRSDGCQAITRPTCPDDEGCLLIMYLLLCDIFHTAAS